MNSMRFEGNNLFFENGNGRTYQVILINPILQVAILKRVDQDSYTLVKGIVNNCDSWNTGSYDLTYEQALKAFNDYTGRA